MRQQKIAVVLRYFEWPRSFGAPVIGLFLKVFLVEVLFRHITILLSNGLKTKDDVQPRAAMPDIEFVVHNIIAEGETSHHVFSRYARVREHGPEPTSKRINVTEMQFKVINGKIVERA